MTVRVKRADGLHMLLLGLAPDEINRLKNEKGVICEGTLPAVTSVQCIGITAVSKAETIAAQLRTSPDRLLAEFAEPKQTEPCRWTQMDHGGSAYNTCESGHPFHIEQGCEPWPYCHWCGKPVVLVPWDQWGDEAGSPDSGGGKT